MNRGMNQKIHRRRVPRLQVNMSVFAHHHYPQPVHRHEHQGGIVRAGKMIYLDTISLI